MRTVGLACISFVVLSAAGAGADRDWPVYGGDKGSTRYSPLTQIDRSNVSQLKVAWTFHTGDKRDNPASTIECSPVVVDGIMYVVSPGMKVFALNAATGAEIWRFDPSPDTQKVQRGVAYWRGADDRRILFTAGDKLICLDATTGRPVETFGDHGRVSLKAGLDRDVSKERVASTTPGVVYKDLLILGTSVDEGPGPTAPGHIRAYDVRTGKIVWIFHTIPFPGEPGYETWSPNSYKTVGAANCWGGMSLDEKRGVVYLATGSPAYDFMGNDRKGDNLYANCVLALKAATGKYVWHFQAVHHDLWDYDLPCAPVLATVTHEGKKKDAVAQVSKMGFVFLLDRDTGKPLFPVEERPVPASKLAGEYASATQPFPVKPPPLVRQKFTEADITDISQVSHDHVLKRFREYTAGQIFTPPFEGGLVQLPGFHGGCNWSGAAFDSSNGRLYANVDDAPNLQTMAVKEGSGYPFVSTGYFKFNDPEGFPAIKPPWSVLASVDMNRGDVNWRIPLGEYPVLVKRGIRHTGTETFGGCIVTAGGLVFIGATMDMKFHAFDKETGKLLWETVLETGGMATPCTYEAGGKQYVVIAAGGGFGQRTPNKYDSPPGDAYVAFALP